MHLDFPKLIKNIGGVKLKGGVVGKTYTVLIFIIVMFGIIAIVSKDAIVTYVVLGLISLICFITIMRLINFANKNPQAAILEGAEFLVHQQIEHAAKGVPQLPISTIITQAKAISNTDESRKQINMPDVTTGEIEKEGNNA